MLGKINIIFGSTASGKTAYGVELAKRINGEIINADSMQIYRELPILTAQPTNDEMQNIEHHMYGFKNALSHYSVGEFINDVTEKIKDILKLGKTPILVGGTGMYIKSLVEGIPQLPKISDLVKEKLQQLNLTSLQLYEQLKLIDPISAAQLFPNDTQRTLRALEVFYETGESIASWQAGDKIVTFSRDKYHIIWLNPARDIIYKKINARFYKLIERGAIWEVAKLLKMADGKVLPKPHGLPEIRSYLIGDISYNEMIAKSQQITRNYAKRQQTWARHQFMFDEVIESGI